MTAKRSAMLASALRMTMGTRRMTTMREAIKDRASFSTSESENMDIFGSWETLDWGCNVREDFSDWVVLDHSQ